METRIILTVGAILLGSGCIGLLVVRLSNPFFKGLGWLGCSFAAGGVGAALLSANINGVPGPIVLGAYGLILLAYVFLHVCILEITDHKTRVPKLGIALVGIQTGAYPVYAYFHCLREFSVVSLGFLVAIQALQTAMHLKKSSRAKLEPHLWFSILMLAGFAGYNVFRSMAVLILGTPQNPLLPNPFEVLTSIVFLGTGLGLGFGVFWIISAEIRLKLELLANTDPLTGLYNRRSFRSWCEREQLISTRTGEPFSLILLDLDDFKQINDRYGHDAGDAALCAVVERLRNGIRNIDVLGRWGGEEFVALLPGAGSEAALLVAQRLRGSVESLKISRPATRAHAAETNFSLTISLGVATHLGSSDSIDDLLRRCDQALYQAKADGRNRVVHVNA